MNKPTSLCAVFFRHGLLELSGKYLPCPLKPERLGGMAKTIRRFLMFTPAKLPGFVIPVGDVISGLAWVADLVMLYLSISEI